MLPQRHDTPIRRFADIDFNQEQAQGAVVCNAYLPVGLASTLSRLFFTPAAFAKPVASGAAFVI
jgi:hypothetical protein